MSIKHFYLIFLLPVLFIAPLTRVFSLSSVPPDHTFRLPDILQLEKVGQFDAANQGPYQVMGFKSTQCEGSIAIVPLERNAEGAHILRYFLSDPDLTFGFVFAGELHTTFPQWAFTLERFKKQLGQFTANPNILSSQALAYAESGHCGIAQQIAKTLY